MEDEDVSDFNLEVDDNPEVEDTSEAEVTSSIQLEEFGVAMSTPQQRRLLSGMINSMKGWKREGLKM